jgi:hypothetical protein
VVDLTGGYTDNHVQVSVEVLTLLDFSLRWYHITDVISHCRNINADEMQLDYIGLLSTGNEEMLRFAWKTFSRWQMRTESSDKEKKEKHESFRYMEQFRETFSRPIDSIRFVGLFDCVNRLVEREHRTPCTSAY